MKIVAIGDAYITPKMMGDAISKFDFIDDYSLYFFGNKDRRDMRNIVKAIELGRRDEFDLPDGVEEAVKDADIIMVHLCPVTEKLINNCKNLKFVLCNRGGVENIDVDLLNEKGIILVNNPAHNANAVAEYTIGLILSETRNISRACEFLKKGCWRESFPNTQYAIRELKNMTIGLLGFGSVGRLVFEKLKSFGCKIIIHDPFIELDAANVILNNFVSMEELLKTSDVVSVHVRSKDVVLTKDKLELLKENAYIINTSRPNLIDNAALLELLKNKKIMGAAIDVFENEPIIPKQYTELDNITITNHRGGDTLESYSDSPKMMLENLKGYMDNKNLKFWVNKNKISNRGNR